MSGELQITRSRHPDYRKCSSDWRKWRLTYNGGREFVHAYLEQYSRREDNVEFQTRRKLTYCPRFAGAAIDDVKNAIYQRMSDVLRLEGDPTYNKAVVGLDGGVDMNGSTMNRFIGQICLPELLVMAKVGVYIDMPELTGKTIVETQGKRPYLYPYYVEDIASWCGSYRDNCFMFTSLLLRDTEDVYDPVTNLATTSKTIWRFYKLEPEGVSVTFYDNAGKPTGEHPKMFLAGMKQIPFIVMELDRSLMVDIADYQISLMNLESSDTDYMRRSNFPMYVEQYDPRTENNYTRNLAIDPNCEPVPTEKEVTTGSSFGRRYPVGAEHPRFIHPSSEPILASMQKEQAIKNDIRKLLGLSLSNLEPKFASAESKGMDDRTLESGLASLGLTLEHGERQIAKVWAAYLNAEPAFVSYPRSYSLKSEAERREEAKIDSELLSAVPSVTYQKEIAVKIARTMVGHLVDAEKMEKIQKEIYASKYMSSNPDDITKDLTNGLVGNETASKARGYADGEVEAAKKDQAEKLALIQKAQAKEDGSLTNPAARGVDPKAPGKGNTDPDNTEREPK